MPDCDCEGASVGGIARAVRCAASCPESGPGATRRALPNQIGPGAREICAPPSRVPGAAFRPSAPPPGGSLPASKRPAREKRGRTRARRRRARPILRRSAASRAKAPRVVRVTTPAVASWRPFGAAARVRKARVRVKRLKRRRGARQKNVGPHVMSGIWHLLDGKLDAPRETAEIVFFSYGQPVVIKPQITLLGKRNKSWTNGIVRGVSSRSLPALPSVRGTRQWRGGARGAGGAGFATARGASPPIHRALQSVDTASGAKENRHPAPPAARSGWRRRGKAASRDVGARGCGVAIRRAARGRLHRTGDRGWNAREDPLWSVSTFDGATRGGKFLAGLRRHRG